MEEISKRSHKALIEHGMDLMEDLLKKLRKKNMNGVKDNQSKNNQIKSEKITNYTTQPIVQDVNEETTENTTQPIVEDSNEIFEYSELFG